MLQLDASQMYREEIENNSDHLSKNLTNRKIELKKHYFSLLSLT